MYVSSLFIRFMPLQTTSQSAAKHLVGRGSIYTSIRSALAVRRKATAKLLLFFDITKLFEVFFLHIVLFRFFVVLLQLQCI